MGHLSAISGLRRSRRALLACLVLLVCAGCKVKIIVPEHGKVVTADGDFTCNTGEDCVFDITDDTFDETFVAVPDPGWGFSHWKTGNKYFCGNNRLDCRLFTTQFAGTPLEPFLEKSDTFFLEPVFVRFNQAYWAGVLAEIDAGSHTTDAFLYDIVPNVDQCDPGALTPAAKNRAQEALNEVRDLHGLPAVDYTTTFDMQMAEASLVQIANNTLTHFPPPEFNCYSQSAADGARSSNLGFATSGGVDPAADVFGWTNDNFNLAALEAAGHRRWNLFPSLDRVSYGQVRGASALKVFDFGTAPPSAPPRNLDYVAMPEGIYPYILVSAGDNPTPWSLSMITPGDAISQFDYFSRAEVEVKTSGRRARTLKVHSVYSDTDTFGLGNFLSWMVDDWKHDTQYIVTVSNIRTPGGSTTEVSYPVVIARYHLVDLEEPLESGDGRQGNNLQGRFDTPDDADSYVVSLDGQVSFSGRSNFSNQAFYILVYDATKTLVHSSDAAFSLDLNAGAYTVVVSPCGPQGGCYQGTMTYNVTIN